jgi:hypothetical protein
MRADRLKQVMQQIDSSFDEKNVGKAKFSLFVTEAAKRGLVSLNKLENGQLEVDLPGAAAAPQAEAAPVAAAAATTPAAAPAPQADEEDRSRRGKGRDRGRGRRDREPKPEAKAAALPVDKALVDKAPVEAKVPEKPLPDKGDRDAIGVQGLRLTRDEAFDLVKRAVDAAATGNKATPASRIRAQARELLGRDSESLSERNFLRILHDAHDADVIDLRKRGSDYEVAKAAAAPTVERQLETAAIKNAPTPPPAVPARRGMGARGIGRPGSGKGAPPANLLNVGVVALPSAAPVSAPTNTAKAPEDTEAVAAAATVADAAEAPAKGRKRGGAKKAARKKTEGAPAGAPAAKRGGRKKTAAT